MTPFEIAKANVRHLANGLYFCNLIQETLKNTEGLTDEEADLLWYAILSLLEEKGIIGEEN